MRRFKGRAIYTPSGKAEEYSIWACNFYNGCSAKCEYCYNRDDERKMVVGEDYPTLKKSLRSERLALKIFEAELQQNLSELQKDGIFFNFVSDPFLPETTFLNQQAIYICHENNVPVKVLTKQAKWVDKFIKDEKVNKNLIACGFTLTGCDELESGASPNQERINAMKKLHDAEYKTFASIEPIIDCKRSFLMIEQTIGYCDLYLVGLESKMYKKDVYNTEDVSMFISDVLHTIEQYPATKIYWKNSMDWYCTLQDKSHSQVVSSNYNMFK